MKLVFNDGKQYEIPYDDLSHLSYFNMLGDGINNDSLKVNVDCCSDYFLQVLYHSKITNNVDNNEIKFVKNYFDKKDVDEYLKFVDSKGDKISIDFIDMEMPSYIQNMKINKYVDKLLIEKIFYYLLEVDSSNIDEDTHQLIMDVTINKPLSIGHCWVYDDDGDFEIDDTLGTSIIIAAFLKGSGILEHINQKFAHGANSVSITNNDINNYITKSKIIGKKFINIVDKGYSFDYEEDGHNYHMRGIPR